MAKKKQLWERQPWDTQASFNYFHTYYLSQVPPRSVNKAYRMAQADKGKTVDRKLEASRGWRNWSMGLNYSRKEIKGAVSWAERAFAFDEFCAANNIDQWIEKREQVRQEDWLLGEKMRALVHEIIDEGPNFIIQRRKVTKGKDGNPDRVIITLALDVNAAVKAGGLASKLQRLAAGMETENLGGELDIQNYVVILPDNERGDREVEDVD